MENPERGTRTNIPLGGEYQVFLNFRGCDVRRGFADTLYHSLDDAQIRIFMDDAEIRAGEIIGDKLMRAIDNSKLYIPIFSPNYASSHWCLIELAKMMENISKSKEDENKKLILPIFYDVEPDELKLPEEHNLQRPSYRDAILKLEKKKVNRKKKFSKKDVDGWRTALREVDQSKGLKLRDHSGDGHLSKSVVSAVVNWLRIRQRRVPEDVVGMEGPIATLNNYLDISSDDVRLILICGMSGIGKTTLAKIIYNQLCPYFENCCSFLGDIRERGEKDKGLVKLQKTLFSDISNTTMPREIDESEDGIKAIEGTICNKKVLIVLDDVSDCDQIPKLIGTKPLCSGSRILVTTKEKSNLKIKGLTPAIYELNQLNYQDSLQLFSRYAFGTNSPPANYYGLSDELVSIMGGLPLALQAIGASLNGQEDKKIWQETIEDLRNKPYGNVSARLKVTYDLLESTQQTIFLDIACFFINDERTEPMLVWEESRLRPNSAIDVLTKKCMIKILDNDTIWMHEQFRALGRSIAKDTRLWDKDDIIDKLRSPEEKPSVRALYFRSIWSGPPTIVTAEEIKRFPNLQLLRLSYVNLQGDFAGCVSNLKCIYLSHIRVDDDQLFMPTGLHLRNLLVMNTDDYDWTEDAVKSLIKEATKLKALTLESCRLTHGTLNFYENSDIEKLRFLFSSSLKKISYSIRKSWLTCVGPPGSWSRLTWLTYQPPGSWSRLTWLTCVGPPGSWSRLTYLDCEDCEKLEKLPEQIGDLKKLQRLSLKGCKSLRELPHSMSELESLTKLDASFSGIRRLPGTMSKLSRLHTLDLERCGEIQELPELPRSLTILRLISQSLRSIPNVSNLTNLVELFLWDESHWRDQSNIIHPCKLLCIEKLSKLKKLHLILSEVCAISTEWDSLSLLEELKLHGLGLQMLKQLPANLRVLWLQCIEVKQVELDGLPNLEELYFRACQPVATISIKSSSNKLRHVHVHDCKSLVEVQFRGVLKSMESLKIERCSSFERLVCLSEGELGCNELQAPELNDGRRRVSFVVSSSLKMLRNLDLSYCSQLQEIQFISTLEALKELSVFDCISLKKISGLSNLKNLISLRTVSCKKLQFVEGTDELERLEKLAILECESMEKIIDASISRIPNECRIVMISCGQLPSTGPWRHPIIWKIHYADSLEGSFTWECYREMILNAQTQASEAAIKTTSFETGDPPLEQQDDGDEDDDNDKNDGGEDDGRDDDNDDNVHEDHENDDGEDDEVNNVHLSRRSSPVCSEDDNDENDDVDEEGEGEARSCSNSKDEEDDDGEDDEDNNLHEVLQSSHGTPPVHSVGGNSENNDVDEEGNTDEDRTRTRKRKRGTMKKPKRSKMMVMTTRRRNMTTARKTMAMKTMTRATTMGRTTSTWTTVCRSICSCLAGLCELVSMDNDDEEEEGERRRQRRMRWQRRGRGRER